MMRQRRQGRGLHPFAPRAAAGRRQAGCCCPRCRADVLPAGGRGRPLPLLAEDNRINLRLLPPPRGRIVDRTGKPLAVNVQNYRVVLVPSTGRRRRWTLDVLTGGMVEIERAARAACCARSKRKRAFVPVTVRET